MARPCMAQAIVERLLRRAIEHDVGPRRERRAGELRVDVEPDRHARVRPRALGQVQGQDLDGAREAQLVQGRRSYRRAERVQLVDQRLAEGEVLGRRRSPPPIGGELAAQVQGRLQWLVVDVSHQVGALQALVERVQCRPLRFEQVDLRPQLVGELRVAHERGEVAAERGEQGMILGAEGLARRLGTQAEVTDDRVGRAQRDQQDREVAIGEGRDPRRVRRGARGG